MEKLLNAGAEVNERGVNGETPLMFAARNGNLEALNLLLKRGAEVNAKEVAARHHRSDVGRGTETYAEIAQASLRARDYAGLPDISPID